MNFRKLKHYRQLWHQGYEAAIREIQEEEIEPDIDYECWLCGSSTGCDCHLDTGRK